jgi:hypothetical protein
MLHQSVSNLVEKEGIGVPYHFREMTPQPVMILCQRTVLTAHLQARACWQRHARDGSLAGLVQIHVHRRGSCAKWSGAVFLFLARRWVARPRTFCFRESGHENISGTLTRGRQACHASRMAVCRTSHRGDGRRDKTQSGARSRAHRQATNVENYDSSPKNRRCRPCQHLRGCRRIVFLLLLAGLRLYSRSNYLKSASVVSAHSEKKKNKHRVCVCCLLFSVFPGSTCKNVNSENMSLFPKTTISENQCNPKRLHIGISSTKFFEQATFSSLALALLIHNNKQKQSTRPIDKTLGTRWHVTRERGGDTRRVSILVLACFLE